jgi:hypothetical protein
LYRNVANLNADFLLFDCSASTRRSSCLCLEVKRVLLLAVDREATEGCAKEGRGTVDEASDAADKGDSKSTAAVSLESKWTAMMDGVSIGGGPAEGGRVGGILLVGWAREAGLLHLSLSNLALALWTCM